MTPGKNKVIVRGLIEVEEKKLKTYIWLSYHNVHHILDDEHVNDDNFSKIQREEPERLVTIRNYLQKKTVPIKKVHIRAIGTKPFNTTNLNHHSEFEEDD